MSSCDQTKGSVSFQQPDAKKRIASNTADTPPTADFQAGKSTPAPLRANVPADAVALSYNITVTQGTASGDLRVYRTGITPPLVSTINYRAGQTLANNGVVVLGAAGDFVIQSDSAGSVQVIIDVNGYFK